MMHDAIEIIDRKIAETRDDEEQYKNAILNHMRGERELGSGQFKWNRENLVRCNHRIQTLKELRRDIIDNVKPI